MTKFILFFLVMAVFLPVESRAQGSIITEINYSQLEELIQLAKTNYPRKKIFEANEAIAKNQVPATQWSYLEPFSGAYFYRPNNKIAIDVVNPFLVNGFQFGVNLNLGSFLQKPYQVTQAKKQHQIAKLENEEFDMVLESLVKSRYYDYIQAQNELKIRTGDKQDSKTILNDLQYKFELGEVDLETYSAARSTSSTANSAHLQAEVNFLKAKDALEEVIGVRLSDLSK